MLRALMLVSGCIEIVFGVVAVVAPDPVIEAVGATGDVQAPILALISLLGAATLGLGVGALIGRNHLKTVGGRAAAYGLGLYNVVGALVLLFAASDVGSSGLWGGAVLHAVIALLFVYAFATRKSA
jgi:Na+-driven multidrug efflux pump